MSYAPKIVLQLPISDLDLVDSFVEECLRDGVALIAVVGTGASKIDDIIDDIVVGDGSDPGRYITTSFHEDATIEEVLEFARMWKVDRDQAVQLVKL